MRDFLGFKTGMVNKGGTIEGRLPSVSLRWKQLDSWSTSERPTQLKAVKLDIFRVFSNWPGDFNALGYTSSYQGTQDLSINKNEFWTENNGDESAE